MTNDVAAVPVGDLVNWLRVITPMTEMSESDGDTSNSECVGNMQKTTQTPVTIVKDNNSNNHNNHKLSMQPHEAPARWNSNSAKQQ